MLRKPLHPQARYLARWLVALMVFVNLHSALAATLVLAMGAGGVAMVEVCTSQGVRWVSVQQAAPADAKTAQEAPGWAGGVDGSPHCPLCRFMGDAAPDLARSDLRFARPQQHGLPPPDTPPPLSTAARVVLMAPPRAPPIVLI